MAKEITFEQARRARQVGYRVQLTYVAAEVEECVERVAKRVQRGGHGVSPGVLRETYAASMRNLPRAIREFDIVQVYDNARTARPTDAPDQVKPRLVLESQRGFVTYVDPTPPRWLTTALTGTEHDQR